MGGAKARTENRRTAAIAGIGAVAIVLIVVYSGGGGSGGGGGY
ncbi:MAG TPA: hypothetical protein VF025_02750 [Gaiellaceae bacterium]